MRLSFINGSERCRRVRPSDRHTRAQEVRRSVAFPSATHLPARGYECVERRGGRGGELRAVRRGAMESDGLVVSEAVKFPVTRQTGKTSHKEVQTHGYEVDLIGARADRLVLATVKSFFGSRGVV